ncbi:MAG: DNA replication/repair protein RecF [Alphaproteobacteria bacterium]|nr:DNA replication/repair protein RecF [Alphaproteobacteria bacterium]
MSHITRLQLTNFRSYAQACLERLHGGPVVLTGPNGAGKTNILEAVSLFSPGRGLRGAKMTEMQQRGDDAPWALSATVETPYGSAKIGTGLDPATEKRIVRVNGETARGQTALSEYLSCVWLTPQMDRIFLDSAGSRRRFLDRLVFTFDPGHTGRVTRYENAMGQRSKLLREGKGDPAWLAGLEAQMAETGVAISAARLDYVQRLQRACDKVTEEETTHFPRARIGASGFVEESLSGMPALRVEEMFREKLAQARAADAATGGAAFGPHRSDLLVAYAAKDMPAAQCSTGEQKALLVGIILAHARLLAAERGIAPVLLLDEVAAHLDDSRRAALFRILLSLRTQVWLTGTDAALFAGLQPDGQFCTVDGGRVFPVS